MAAVASSFRASQLCVHLPQSRASIYVGGLSCMPMHCYICKLCLMSTLNIAHMIKCTRLSSSLEPGNEALYIYVHLETVKCQNIFLKCKIYRTVLKFCHGFSSYERCSVYCTVRKQFIVYSAAYINLGL